MLGRKKVGYFVAIRPPLLLFASDRGFGLRVTVQHDRPDFGLGSRNAGIEASSIRSGLEGSDHGN